MVIHEATISFRPVSESFPEPLGSPSRIVEYMRGAFDADPTVEWFYVVILNRKNVPMGRCCVTKGTASASLVHAREVFKPVILAGATALAVVHNHPSGDPSPSMADIEVTRSLRRSAKIMGLDLLDHVIIGGNGTGPRYHSFSEAGML